MMRTIEVLIVIIIILGAFVAASYYAVLPVPRRVSPMNLKRLALTTLQILDSDYNLSAIVFKHVNSSDWVRLQVALSTLLPPNVVYNLTVYDIKNVTDGAIYVPYKSISNTESLGIQSEATSILVASSNVTFKVIPEKIGERSNGGTLYILNCSDANGWWITGYTAYSLAEDLYRILSPYFKKTIMVQNTTDLGKILDGTRLENETLEHAVIINTFGETVPIPSGYYMTQGYDSQYQSYAKYCYMLGQKVREHNWTWVSIVGYPLYYVSNKLSFTGPNDHNGYGIYGMKCVGPAGLNAFLDGLDNKPYGNWWWDNWDKCWKYDADWITGDPEDNSRLSNVSLSLNTLYYCNYYGIYPSRYQTSTRALPSWITTTFNLKVTTYVFDPVDNWIPGAMYRHILLSTGHVNGSLFALGLTRTPDIRLTAIGILCDYRPRLYRSEYNATGTSRFVVLQLGLAGGI